MDNPDHPDPLTDISIFTRGNRLQTLLSVIPAHADPADLFGLGFLEGRLPYSLFLSNSGDTFHSSSSSVAIVAVFWFNRITRPLINSPLPEKK
jgi:hypothetical protein